MTEVKSDYEDYVEKYARNRGISTEEAKDHALVREYKKYYEEKESQNE
jgi:hypothetical protein